MTNSCRFLRILFVFCFLNLALAGSKTLVAQDNDGDGFFAGVDDCDDTQWLYADNDGDGFGAGPLAGCGVPDNTDCDDALQTWSDIDGDGFGSGSFVACGGVPDNTDCDDAQFLYADNDGDGFGGAPVGCGILDNSDCDDFQWLYPDNDGDGFGAFTNTACGIVDNTDCDDGNNLIFPLNPEVCDGLDNDCSGLIDDGGLTFMAYYIDNDLDGYGDDFSSTTLCSDPGAPYITTGGDCDDNNNNNFPLNTEICDGLDNNCSFSADEGLSFSNYYEDLDGDGFGSNYYANLCYDPGAPYVTASDDCNDGDIAINPSALEVCDGIDNDCNGMVDDGLTFTPYYNDTDGDGYGSWGQSYCQDPGAGWSLSSGDCNDSDTTVFPGATEICDGQDNDCNSLSDEGLFFQTYYYDNDMDGYGDFWNTNFSCTSPGANWSLTAGDCNNWDSNIYPGATEVCDGVDNDCNNLTDDGLSFTEYFYDDDGDGYGTWQSNYCNDPGAPYTLLGGDCDGWNPAINPGATEICNGIDDNCNGETDEGISTTYFYDNDADGYGSWSSNYCFDPGAPYVLAGGDCEDLNYDINPGASEICDGKDNNCDGTIDEGFSESKMYYYDGDNDGYGGTNMMQSCVIPGPGWILYGGDCSEWDPNMYPGADEVCNGMDDNCDGQIDEGFGESLTYYRDWDGDGYGADWDSTNSCNPMDSTYSLVGGDCDNWNFAIYPGAVEICDGMDNNCNGEMDEGTGLTTYYWDNDFDGYGVDWNSTTFCNPPSDSGWATTGGDCADWDVNVNPGATEICDGWDNNCNAMSDEGFTFLTYYWDGDNDGFGVSWSTNNSCQSMPNWALVDGDCDDNNNFRFPGNPEICDSYDNDCNGFINEGLTYNIWYWDGDGDGFGGSNSQNICSDPGLPWTLNGGDCEDWNTARFPGNPEICDGQDNDCNGTADDGITYTTYYYDGGDGDGFGSWSQDLCSDPGVPYVLTGGDCDEWNAAIFPGNPEVCDGLDNDCNMMGDDGLTFTTYFYDSDGDAYGSWSASYCSDPGIPYVLVPGDCDDGNPAINPGATEICDGYDNNCDSQIDEGFPVLPSDWYYFDNDFDAVGGMYFNYIACDPGPGFINNSSDCDDNEPAINPSAAEVVCDGIDNNCNGQIDEGAPLTYYYDNDADGYGANSGFFCADPGSPWSLNPNDCNDNDNSMFPGNSELCDGKDNNCDFSVDEGLVPAPPADYWVDNDGDSYGYAYAGNLSCTGLPGLVTIDGDCDDTNPAVYPVLVDNCNGIDDDCDGMYDEDAAFTTYYWDYDGDGFGWEWNTTSICTAPDTSAWVLSIDCQEWNAAIFPGNPEICDGIDNDCNAITDDGLTFNTFYFDNDLDGYGDDMSTQNICYLPDSTWSLTGGDCNDWNLGINPGAPEICDGLDNDCNGMSDDGLTFNTYYYDTDLDGYGYDWNTQYVCFVPDSTWSLTGSDCDDWNAGINPGMVEICDGMDNDCNGMSDDGLTFTTYYQDNDADGYGDDMNTQNICYVPDSTWVLSGGDCNIWDASINPGATEICNAMDDNCDGMMDDGLTFNTYYQDNDGDGYGYEWNSISVCYLPDSTWSLLSGDCDDWNPGVNPGSIELCGGPDENCNGMYDEGLTFSKYFYDWDNDGYGNPWGGSNLYCYDPGMSYSLDSTDCDDNNSGKNPGAIEICNGKDENCNGEIDEGLPVEPIASYYYDMDMDGYGMGLLANLICNPGLGYSTVNGDCNDNNPASFPGNPEVCDGYDNDCNGTIDDSFSESVKYYNDNDGDGFGDNWNFIFSCVDPGSPWLLNNGDCNDMDPTVNPSAVEICDGMDNNCDGIADDGCAMLTFYYDGNDNDGYGSWSQDFTFNPGSPWVALGGDCYEWNPLINPSAIEKCDGKDNNCDGLIDEGFTPTLYYYDGDGDTYGDDGNIKQTCSSVSPVWVLAGGDCQPWNPAINPSAIEICNEMDDNCDGMVDEGFSKTTYYYDGEDGDGYGTAWSQDYCVDPGFPWSLLGGDCDMWNASINPGAFEDCDYIDNNCDGMTDEGYTKTTYYNDMDADGYGSWMQEFCSDPGSGWSLTDGDCNDLDTLINPLATEICDNIDNNCDGIIDEGFSQNTYFYDGDNDGYGDFGNFAVFCLNPGLDWSLSGGDCDNGDPNTYPGAVEVCDGKDNNCNGEVNEGLGTGSPVYYCKDEDSDGFGGGWCMDLTCTPDPSWVTMVGDCQDWDPAINPAAAEIPCNGIDENCDGATDENSAYTLYSDWDNDGYGGSAGYFCNPNPGYPWITTGGDCADWNPAINPVAMEICDGQDNNCDGSVDEGCSMMTFFYDGGDYDGYGTYSQDFSYIPGTDWSTMGGDCEEWNPAVNPGATEICNGKDDNCDGQMDEGFVVIPPTTYFFDNDWDGFGSNYAGNFICTPDSQFVTNDLDCDDWNFSVNPSAIEICDGMDNNCDGTVNEGFTESQVYFKDNDGDGFGVDWDTKFFCAAPDSMWAPVSGDCLDWDIFINPSAAEICDGVDNNCDGTVDEGYTKTTYFSDGDNDGYGSWPQDFCVDPGMGWSLVGGDCAEWDMNINPAALEICNGTDDNCDGAIDEGFSESTVYYYDADFDGFGVDWNTMLSCVNPGIQWSLIGGDCDEANPATNPAASEICDNKDNNCDGVADEGFSKTTYFTDWDGDSFGGWAQEYCSDPGWPWMLVGGDCDDNNPAMNPGVAEVCDELDNNCDGMVDEGFSKTAYFNDLDADGYGTWEQMYCVDPGVGWSLVGGDCNDGKFEINPAATEVCNSIDDNCNGFVDEGLADGSPATNYFWNLDGDAFGGNWAGTLNCTPSVPYLSNVTGDCNDNDITIYPGAPEAPCNGIDENCDGVVDEGSTYTLYSDYDNDGYGGNVGYFCTPNPGNPWIVANGDCADWDASTYPGAVEICDGQDNNCDGTVDEGCTVTTYYYDGDMDGYGTFSQDFSFVPGPDWALMTGDCDDSNPVINPAGIEICNGKDDNCDGSVDEGYPVTGPASYFYDLDGDNYGSAFVGNFLCTPVAPFTALSGDCNDADTFINPGAAEVCDAFDNNCNGDIDEGFAESVLYYMDNDGDGFGDNWNSIRSCTDPGSPYVATSGDCNDWDVAINPGAVEICDNIDNNCDGMVDEGFSLTTYFNDADNDGYGTWANNFCVDPGMGWSLVDGDCVEWDAAINPGATEICNGIDDNCDGTIDEGFAGSLVYFFDNDADGYGNNFNNKQFCSDPGFPWTLSNGDCDDWNPAVNPSATEVCNGMDDNCDGAVDEGFATTTYYADADGDAFGRDGNITESCFDPGAGWVLIGGDCDDNNPAINPTAIEICNEIDDNCDGVVDEGSVKTTYFWDGDTDGFGDWSQDYCVDPGAPYVLAGGDCQDWNATVYPGALELCDGLDNNCDGNVDEGLTPDPGADYWFDNDGDTYGGAYAGFLTCTAGPNVVTNDADCDDNNATINPGAAEVPCNGLDDNCDGVVDEGGPFVVYADMDGDGFGSMTAEFFCADPGAPYLTVSGDCDDTNPGAYPGALEICNGIDDNCDGVADEGFSPVNYFADGDADGFGNDATLLVACVDPGAPYVTTGGDCNDGDATINPGATEVCDGIDNDCSGLADDGIPYLTYYEDNDTDGFGVDASAILLCSDPGSPFVLVGGDCNDADAAVNPSAVEVCDSIDNNCDGSIDEGVQNTYYADADGDTYGDAGTTASDCSTPLGFVSDNTDCNDADATINPSAVEVCDSIDNNCDGSIDEGVQNTYYADADGDTYGDAGTTASDCSAPLGFVSDNTDCNDADAAINPSAVEVCDSIDNNCDGQIDEGVQNTYYADTDGDTYGDAGTTASDCSAPLGFVSDNTDCNDADAAINPSAIEVCDSIDNNCDGQIDEGVQNTYYADADGDTYGDAGTAASDCSAPFSFVSDNTDCNDADAAVNPSAVEVCDGIDNNCEGSVDEGVQTTYFVDADGDTFGDAGNTTLDCSTPVGYVSDNTDCNDADAAINPSAIEVCDSIDNNCDGQIDEGVQNTYYADADGDTYGDAGTTASDCSAPLGFVSDNTDCNDADAAINPSAVEVCDGIDNNCDGTADDGVQTTYFADVDSDTYGDAGNSIFDCSAPAGYVSDNTDCDDLNGGINPGASEICDGIDNNCDGSIDEGVQNIYFADLDGDSFGDAGNSTTDCSAPVGFVTDNTDCDDLDGGINPGASEICDGIDNNCDGSIDEGAKNTYFADLDGDSFGDSTNAISDCSAPVGYVSDNTDCNDLDGGINPGASDICDGVDNNCDGSIDESGQFAFYADLDGDTYGDVSNVVMDCSAPVGYVSDSTDCNDLDSGINPSATEIVDGVDNNCDGNIDEVSVKEDISQLTNSFEIYPMPANDYVNFKLTTNIPGTNLTLKIKDVKGRLVLSKPVTISKKGEILGLDVKEFNQGLYQITITGDSFKASAQFIITR